MIFGIIATPTTTIYTEAALASLLRYTAIARSDRIMLILNGRGSLPTLNTVNFTNIWVEVISHTSPHSFAENVNIFIESSKTYEEDLVVPNNDVVFTRDWLSPIIGNPECISLPVCNQQHQYAEGILQTNFLMDYSEFSDNYSDLEKISHSHRQKTMTMPPWRARIMPFFCFYLSKNIIRKVGLFDTNFGRGGGEDVDYRLRSILAGYDVVYQPKSYLLHFMGKSSWRGAESVDETQLRNRTYVTRFQEKWGAYLAENLLSGGPHADKSLDEFLERATISELAAFVEGVRS